MLNPFRHFLSLSGLIVVTLVSILSCSRPDFDSKQEVHGLIESAVLLVDRGDLLGAEKLLLEGLAQLGPHPPDHASLERAEALLASIRLSLAGIRLDSLVTIFSKISTGLSGFDSLASSLSLQPSPELSGARFLLAVLILHEELRRVQLHRPEVLAMSLDRLQSFGSQIQSKELSLLRLMTTVLYFRSDCWHQDLFRSAVALNGSLRDVSIVFGINNLPSLHQDSLDEARQLLESTLSGQTSILPSGTGGSEGLACR